VWLPSRTSEATAPDPTNDDLVVGADTVLDEAFAS
jgi:hypothetical protein